MYENVGRFYIHSGMGLLRAYQLRNAVVPRFKSGIMRMDSLLWNVTTML